MQALMDAGAIPFSRTNIPQTMLSYGCSNPIFGCTRNPHNPSRTAGGSSGGEAALIASVSLDAPVCVPVQRASM